MASLSGVEILLVEDSGEYRLLARKILEGDGARVHEADGVEAGMAIAGNKIPHLIITDLEMPGKSGFDLIVLVKNNPQLKGIPIIVLSGRNDPKSVFDAVTLGASDYMIKPFRPPILLQKVKKALQVKSFRKFAFAPDKAPMVKAHCAAQILSVSEIGFMLETSLKIGPETPVAVESELLERLGCKETSTRTTLSGGRYSSDGRYIHEIGFFGIDAQEARRLRTATRTKR